MDQLGFIVALDFGTSKIVGLLGRKNAQGVISVLAVESVPSDSCVKQGVVYNIDEAAGKVKKIINLLENKTGKKIEKVYVSISGRSLRAIEHVQTRALLADQEITFQDTDQMEQQARLNKPEFFTNYSVVAPEIYLDGVKVESQDEAIGRTASLIEGRYRLIVGRPNIKSNLIRCITDRNKLDIAGFIVGPVAAGAIALSEDDKEAGCALVDFGAGTTAVSVYKGGLLRYMSVVPFGGKTITKDIQSLGFVDMAAESYKIKYGRIGKDKRKTGGTVNAPDIDVKELNKVIQLRVDEIIQNVIHQIRESGYADELHAGIIIIGGASQLDGLPEYLAEKSKMNVKKGSVNRLFINNVVDILQNPAYTQCLGLMLFGNENCEKKEPVVVVAAQPETTTEHLNQSTAQTNHRSEIVQPESGISDMEDEEDEDDDDIVDKKNRQKGSKKKKKEDSRQGSLFGFFGKLQNLGGTMFKDEE